MTRFRWIAALSVAAVLLGALGLYSLWPTPKKYAIVIPPKPAIHAEWPVIDCGNTNVANLRPCQIPRASPEKFLLKVKLKNVRDPKNGFFIAFYPEKGTADAKKNWYYGGAIIGPGRQKGDIWEYEGEASVTTFRDQRMRGVLSRGDADLTEVLVEVESGTQN